MIWLTHLDETHWLDRRTDEVLAAEEVFQRYADALPEKLRKRAEAGSVIPGDTAGRRTFQVCTRTPFGA